MERIKSVDEQVMVIFDTEFEDMRQKIFEQVEELWLENGEGELDDWGFNEYVCYYTDLISRQLQGNGISPKEIERYNPIPRNDAVRWG